MALTEKVPLQNKIAELESRIEKLEQWKKEHLKDCGRHLWSNSESIMNPAARFHWDKIWDHMDKFFDKFFDKVFG